MSHPIPTKDYTKPCEHCGGPVGADEFESYDGKLYHPNCLLRVCQELGHEPVSEEEPASMDSGGIIYANYWICERCGKPLLPERDEDGLTFIEA